MTSAVKGGRRPSWQRRWTRVGGPVAAAALLACALVELVDDVRNTPMALELVHAAGRASDAGPLFLKRQGSQTPRRLPACTGCRTLGDAHGSYLEAMACQASGQGDECLGALRRLEAAGYRGSYSSALLSLALHAQGRVADAESVWVRCPGLECEALLVRAGTRQACSAAAVLTRGGRRAAFCLGDLLRREGDLDAAMAQFGQALAAGPDDRDTGTRSVTAEPAASAADILYRMGEVDLARGNIVSAQRSTDLCLEREPRHYWGAFQQAMLFWRAGDRGAAIAQLERVIEWYPGHGAALLNLGLLHEAEGDLEAARQWFLAARNVLPDKELADVQLRRVTAESTSGGRHR